MERNEPFEFSPVGFPVMHGPISMQFQNFEGLMDQDMYNTPLTFTDSSTRTNVNTPTSVLTGDSEATMGTKGTKKRKKKATEPEAEPTEIKQPKKRGPKKKPLTKEREVRLKTRRVRANARERGRMHGLNHALELLRRHVPTFSATQRLSKIETLRLAKNYIRTLSDLLQRSEPPTPLELAFTLTEGLSQNTSNLIATKLQISPRALIQFQRKSTPNSESSALPSAEQSIDKTQYMTDESDTLPPQQSHLESDKLTTNQCSPIAHPIYQADRFEDPNRLCGYNTVNQNNSSTTHFPLLNPVIHTSFEPTSYGDMASQGIDSRLFPCESAQHYTGPFTHFLYTPSHITDLTSCSRSDSILSYRSDSLSPFPPLNPELSKPSTHLPFPGYLMHGGQ